MLYVFISYKSDTKAKEMHREEELVNESFPASQASP